MTYQIKSAESPDDILRCFHVMVELRPHLIEQDFVATVQRQQRGGYHLIYLEASGKPMSVAGYRISESLSRGRFLYVDDLITSASARRRGYGAAMLDWLIAEARKLQCKSIHLDSGLTRLEAHSFYEGKQMRFTARHYLRDIDL